MVITQEKNISSEFFDLKTEITGEILQKFSNYKILMIMKDLSKFEGKSIRGFIFKSNTTKRINFVENLAEALEKLSH